MKDENYIHLLLFDEQDHHVIGEIGRSPHLISIVALS
jgi:hypothetical protein